MMISKTLPKLTGLALAVLTFTAPGCGGYYQAGGSTKTIPSSVVYADTTSTSSTALATSSGTGTAPYSYDVEGVGYSTGVTLTVQAGTTLKVQFTPGIQNKMIEGTSNLPTYSMLGVYVTINGVTQTTAMLSNGYVGGTAQASAVMDFSSAIKAACSFATNCRQTITIKIDHANNDYYCLNTQTLCPYRRIEETHPWNGTLSVQTDDTDALNNSTANQANLL